MSRFYLDSMVWIYALEGSPGFGAAAQRIIRGIRAGNHTLLTSHFLLGEVLVVPSRSGDLFTIASYRKMMTSGSVEVVPFTAEVALQFASIRGRLRTQPADPIHLALAVRARADFFVTADKALSTLSVPGIGQIVGLDFTFE